MKKNNLIFKIKKWVSDNDNIDEEKINMAGFEDSPIKINRNDVYEYVEGINKEDVIIASYLFDNYKNSNRFPYEDLKKKELKFIWKIIKEYEDFQKCLDENSERELEHTENLRYLQKMITKIGVIDRPILEEIGVDNLREYPNGMVDKPYIIMEDRVVLDVINEEDVVCGNYEIRFREMNNNELQNIIRIVEDVEAEREHTQKRCED